jgi:hypothetical protein
MTLRRSARACGEEETMPWVIALLHGLDDTRAKIIRLNPETLVTHTRAITVAAQPIGLPVMVKTLSNGMASALETDGDRARHIHLNALTQPRESVMDQRRRTPATCGCIST